MKRKTGNRMNKKRRRETKEGERRKEKQVNIDNINLKRSLTTFPDYTHLPLLDFEIFTRRKI